MPVSRRDLIKLFGASFLMSYSGKSILGGSVRVKDLPKLMPRMPLNEFVQSSARLAALRKGFSEMKKRKPSDPLSFFFQAALHGVTDEAVKKATAQDPDVPKMVKYFNQCPHFGQNSANFLPWHRGYTYHFEKILRLHTGESDFSLPYWNYLDKRFRKFPKEFGIQHLDGNINNDNSDNINPLFLDQRDFYFTSFEHPFAKGLPLLALSDSAVDISLPMGSPVFFGKTEREGLGGGIADNDPSTRGLLESYPHDQIHRAVGGIIPNGCACACTPAPGDQPDFDATGAMATPPTAGFDPIFYVHHTTIDWIWVQWACKPGKSWGQLPPDNWFNEKAWTFFDPDGSRVNQPRSYYFDHKQLGIRFKYEDPTCRPLQLPKISENNLEAFVATVHQVEKFEEINQPVHVFQTQLSVIPIAFSSIANVEPHFNAMKSDRATGFKNKRVILKFPVVDVRNTESTGFDLHLAEDAEKGHTRADDSFIGSISLFNHMSGTPMSGMDMKDQDDQSQSFDVSNALASVRNINNLKLIVIPYPLLVSGDGGSKLLNRYPLKLSGMQFFSTT